MVTSWLLLLTPFAVNVLELSEKNAAKNFGDKLLPLEENLLK